MLAKLLAAPEMLQTKLGHIMHISGKQLMRKFISMAHKHYEPVIEYKHKTGWIKDHVNAQEEGWRWIESLYMQPINAEAGGWTNSDGVLKDGVNKKMFNDVLELFWLMQDEDSAYDIPWLLYLKWVHEHWDRFEKSAQMAYNIMNFGNLYADLLEWSKPLPLDDGTDDDEDDIDYVGNEKKILGEKS